MSEIEQELILTEAEKKEIEIKELLGWYDPTPLQSQSGSDAEYQANFEPMEKVGSPDAEGLARQTSESVFELEKRQKLALAEGLPPEELPEHLDPDEYYDWRARYGGEPAEEIDYSSGYRFDEF